MSPTKLHILVIPSWYPSVSNPFDGNFVKRHLELLAEVHQITVLHFETVVGQNTKIKSTTQGNLTEILVRYPKRKFILSKWTEARKAFHDAVHDIESIDIIHCHVMLEKGLFVKWAQKLFQKPLFITEHASYLLRENYRHLGFLQKSIIRQLIKRQEAFSVVSDCLKQDLKVLFPHLKVELTPNCIDRDLFRITENKKHEIKQFIHVSTLDRVKNVQGILQAFHRVTQTNNLSFHLTIVAEKPADKIVKLVRELKLESQITIKGPMDLESVAREVQQADCLIQFSHYETFSCVIAEAWSCGIPVISTSVGIANNMPETLGIQVPKNDIQALAQAIEEFISGQKHYDAEVIRSATEVFSNEAVFESFQTIYTHLNNRE